LIVGTLGDVEDWAGGLARALGEDLDRADRRLLVASAYLHDVGYAPQARRTGFHPLDGGVFLRSLGRDRIAGLVANHSGAIVEAGVRGLSEPLSDFPDENTDVRDMLWYCDLTTGPTGASMTLSGRLEDVSKRYGNDHVVTHSLTSASPMLADVISRVERRPMARGADLTS
jgi:hypothetical protein